MRSFIISIALLVLVAAGIVLNSFYLSGISAELLELTERLPDKADGDTEIINRFTMLWYDNRRLIAVSVKFDYIYSINSALISADSFLRDGDDGEYIAAKKLLYEAVLRLQELEKLSLDNII